MKEAAACKEWHETAAAKKASQGAPTSTVNNVEPRFLLEQDANVHTFTSHPRPHKRTHLVLGPSTLQEVDLGGGDGNVGGP